MCLRKFIKAKHKSQVRGERASTNHTNAGNYNLLKLNEKLLTCLDDNINFWMVNKVTRGTGTLNQILQDDLVIEISGFLGESHYTIF